jgi:hypothetical protein
MVNGVLIGGAAAAWSTNLVKGVAIMNFDASWSMGNIITIAITILGGLFAFTRIVSTLGAGLKEQSAAIALLAAHQESAVALLAQSVSALARAADAMQNVLAEQQKQLSVMAIETEITRRMREGQGHPKPQE